MRTSRGKARSSTLALAVAAMALALALATVAEAATYQATVSPDPFSYPATQELVYRLHITTGATPERLWVSVGGEYGGGGPSFLGEGKFLKLEPMRLEGPGTVLRRDATVLLESPFCTAALPDTHGPVSFSSPRLEAEIPANSAAAIALPARPYAHAPWPGMDLAVEFRVGETPVGGEVVRSPSPVNSGRHGLPIHLRADPPGGSACFHESFPPPSVALGSEVLVSGSTDPSVAGQLMTLRIVRRTEPGQVWMPSDLTSVQIHADGSFVHRWRPTAAGDYTLGALYRSQSPALTDDFSRPTTFRITPPAGNLRGPSARVRPAAITAAARVRCRGRRCTMLVRGSVRRPAAAATARCTGKVRLQVAARKRRLLRTHAGVRNTCRYGVRRRLRLGSARTRFVTLRASYLGNSELEPRRGRAVRVRIRR